MIKTTSDIQHRSKFIEWSDKHLLSFNELSITLLIVLGSFKIKWEFYKNSDLINNF